MARHGIVIIDMLNDFAHPDGALYCAGGRTILPNLQKMMAWVRERNAQGNDDVQLIHIQEAHRKHDADFKVRPVHAIKGTWGSDFIPEVYPQGDEYIVQKRRHSAFQHTDLDLYLREEKIDTVVITGAWTNVCCRSTAADALANAYKVITLADCNASKTEEMHKSGLVDLSIFTKVMNLDEYMAAFERGEDPWVGGGDPTNKVE